MGQQRALVTCSIPYLLWQHVARLTFPSAWSQKQSTSFRSVSNPYVKRKAYQRVIPTLIRVGIIKPTVLSFPKYTICEGQREHFLNSYILFARCTGFRVGPQSGLETGENASHFALVFALLDFRICRHVTRRVHICSRVRVGVLSVLKPCMRVTFVKIVEAISLLFISRPYVRLRPLYAPSNSLKYLKQLVYY